MSMLLPPELPVDGAGVLGTLAEPPLLAVPVLLLVLLWLLLEVSALPTSRPAAFSRSFSTELQPTAVNATAPQLSHFKKVVFTRTPSPGSGGYARCRASIAQRLQSHRQFANSGQQISGSD